MALVNEQELDSILNELENDLGEYLASTQNRLAKAREEDGSAPSASAGGSPSASASAGSPSASAPGAEAPEAPSAGGEAPPAAPSPEGAAPSPEAAPADPAADAGPVDPAALEQEYAKLPPEELKAHYLAAKAALFAVMGAGGPDAGGAPGAPGAGAPPAGPDAGAAMAPPDAGAAPMGPPGAAPAAPPMAPPSAGPGPDEMPPPAMKAEVKVSQAGNGGQKAAVAKSEDKVAELEATVEKLVKSLQKIVGQPMQKAVTGENYVPKTGDEPAPAKKLSKAEVNAKLNEATRNPSLKKSDRDLVNRYYEGEVSIDAIEHLLK